MGHCGFSYLDDSLLVVDMQNSFVHGDDPVVHSIPVDGGKELVIGINALQRKTLYAELTAAGVMLIASTDL